MNWLKKILVVTIYTDELVEKDYARSSSFLSQQSVLHATVCMNTLWNVTDHVASHLIA